jgi:hypothetical protein
VLRRAGAELLGTYALVTAGCGAIVVDSTSHALGHGGVAACFGLVILIAVAAAGHLSGAHFNPAVTVAFAGCRHFPWQEVPVYVAGQLLGAVAAAWTLAGLFGMHRGGDRGDRGARPPTKGCAARPRGEAETVGRRLKRLAPYSSSTKVPSSLKVASWRLPLPSLQASS